MRFDSRDTLLTSPIPNPVEFIRVYWKQHELPKSAPETTTNSVRPAPYIACAAVRESSPPSGSMLFCGQNDLY
jgi:hypothetical protein